MTGDPKAIGVQAEEIRDHVPGHRNGLMLEVVTETEVAQHLEKAQMAGVSAHLLKVAVLATGPHTLLHRRRTTEGGLLLTKEVGLERHHARNGEEKVGIVRDETGRGDDGVAPLLEEAEEGASEFVGGVRGHGEFSLQISRGRLVRADDAGGSRPPDGCAGCRPRWSANHRW